METTDRPFLLTKAERAALHLLRAGRPISTSMLSFHLQETAGSLVARLKGLRDQGLVTMEATGTLQRPALHWTITEAGRELVEGTDDEGRAKG